ncbi:hypothetical protein Salat_2557400 [Sesamum alatum]|uniref:Uncharacterized protein n=1 Tax=Sesamum alatum TaxID=300844 RepID=A0AAE2CCP1_9LAMI|nr:hypothetical protein Salat_2557400 [Sesamum alatum]
MLQSGVNDHESSSGGEDFDDSDSEYEYKMESDKDEEKKRANHEGDSVENIVKKANDEGGRVEDTDREEARASDADGEDWFGDENLGHSGGAQSVIENPQKSCRTAPTMFNSFNNARKVEHVQGHHKMKGVQDQPRQ